MQEQGTINFFALVVAPSLLLIFLWTRTIVIHRNELRDPWGSLVLWILISLFIWPVSAGNYFLMRLLFGPEDDC
jgi:hypothetical protein